jgi:hypothetical protein
MVMFHPNEGKGFDLEYGVKTIEEEIDFEDEDEKEEDATGQWLQPPVYKEETIVPSQNDSVNHLITLAGAYDCIVVVAEMCICHCGVIAGLIDFTPQSKLFSC